MGLIRAMEFAAFSTMDIVEITQLFIRTFTDSEGEVEGRSIGKLVENIMTNTDPADIYGYTASEDGRIVGGIFFTRIRFHVDTCAYILSPVAVHTDFQGKGVGQSLVNFGVEQLKRSKVSLIVTYGDPAFYSKLGFKQITEKTIEPPFKLSFPEGWLALNVSGEEVKPILGSLTCVPALNNPELW